MDRTGMSVSPEARPGRFGSPRPRSEDGRLLRGLGRFTDDLAVPGALWAAFVRSPHGHARIRAVTTEAAAAMPGVAAVFTADDMAAVGPMPCAIPRERRSGQPMIRPHRPVLAADVAPHLGVPVAMVVARTQAEALDAAEAVDIDFDPLPVVVRPADAVAIGAPGIWPEAPDNICFVFEVGDAAAVERAFATAAHVTTLRLAITRVSAAALEPRAAIGTFDAAEGRFTLHCQSQKPFILRRELSAMLGVSENAVRVVVPDVGGGFGMKGANFPEYAALLVAAQRLGHPVRWTATRSESFIADDQARDNDTEASLALDAEGRFLALRVGTLANLGAWLSNFGPNSSTNNLGGLSGVYRIGAVHAHVTGVFTNTPPIGTYRGAGRPEATFVIERLIDRAAAETGRDRVALRRLNTIPDDGFPAATGFLFTYDSGAFHRAMDMAARAADLDGFPARREAARARGHFLGLGVVNAIEQAGGGFEEMAELHLDRDGGITLSVGTISNGQGHETAYAQILERVIGPLPGAFRLVQGDTGSLRHGVGTFGSRSASVGGAAVALAADKVIDKARSIASHHLEVAREDLDFADGRFLVAGTDRGLTLAAVAALAYELRCLPSGLEPGLTERAVFVPSAPTFPNGVHVCEAEIDPETGGVALTRYTVVDDVGHVVNPLLLEGQIHGGIAQGAGQALVERIVHDVEDGQLLSGSFMDYAMPRADLLLTPQLLENPVPSTSNPLGIKGAGEAGTVGALSAVVNAVLDALRGAGVEHLDMPLTPARIWEALHHAAK